MFERFTETGRRIVVLAQDEARALNHNYIGTEHLVLGILHDGESSAAVTLRELGLDLDRARSIVREIVGEGATPVSGHIAFTKRAKRSLQQALRVALAHQHSFIGSAHILVALIPERDAGVSVEILRRVGVDPGVARRDAQEAVRAYREDRSVSGGERRRRGRRSTAEPSVPTASVDLTPLLDRLTEAQHALVEEARARAAAEARLEQVALVRAQLEDVRAEIAELKAAAG